MNSEHCFSCKGTKGVFSWWLLSVLCLCDLACHCGLKYVAITAVQFFLEKHGSMCNGLSREQLPWLRKLLWIEWSRNKCFMCQCFRRWVQLEIFKVFIKCYYKICVQVKATFTHRIAYIGAISITIWISEWPLLI